MINSKQQITKGLNAWQHKIKHFNDLKFTNHMDCIILLGCLLSFFVWKRAYWTFYKMTPFVFHEQK